MPTSKELTAKQRDAMKTSTRTIIGVSMLAGVSWAQAVTRLRRADRPGKTME
jgi:hypothetical protein